MSFAGGVGHRSPFADRAKATKSHLSPRRSSAALGGGGGSGRSVQQSLFGKVSAFNGKDSQSGDSLAKVSQLRNGANPDVKEPTTPTRASEGSNVKGIRRDEFSSFNNRRVGTPVKTPRTGFGTIPPRSPKRAYMGSPKYQKVLVERPAFYNSPVAGDSSTESAKKEVSISELQKRLKRFLQDENVPSRCQVNVPHSDNLDEVPYNISRSPRVNPLFRHEEPVLQVAKGGVAFTAGVDLPEENTCVHKLANSNQNEDHHDAGFHGAEDGVGESIATSMQTHDILSKDEDVSAELLTTPSPEAAPVVIPQSLPEGEPDSSDVSNVTNSEASETDRSLAPEDFPVHSEGGDGSQVEEVCDEVAVLEVVDDSEELRAELDQQQSISGIAEVEECPTEDTSPLLINSSVDETLDEQAQVAEAAEVVENSKGEHQFEPKAHWTSEEEVGEEGEEEVEILEPWSQRFLKCVVLAVMVACTMGFMVLASGSQGLLPKSLHSKPVAGCSFSTPSVIPVSIGFMGLGREHEGMPCLPSVHLGLRFLSSTSKSDGNRHESPSPSYTSGSYEAIPLTRTETGIDNVVDFDQLETATNYYKELQGRLFSDVASLTSEGTLSDSSKEEIAVDGDQSTTIEDVSDIAIFEGVADVASEDVSVSAAMEDILELVDEIAKEQQFETLPPNELGHEVSEEILTPHNPESLQTSMDATSDPETDKLPVDMELVNHASDEGLHKVATSEAFSSATTEYLSHDSEDSLIDSQPPEVNPSLVELLITEPASNDDTSISEEASSLLNAASISKEVYTDKYATASPVLGPVEDSSLDISYNIDDIVDVNGHHEELKSQSTTEAINANEVQVESALSEGTCHTPLSGVSSVAVPEEPALAESMAIFGLLVGAVAMVVVFLLSTRKSPTVTQAAETATVDLFPRATAPFKSMGSPVAWPSARSVYDSHVPDSLDELDAITSPLKSTRTPRKYGMESYSTKYYGSVEPTSSAPGLFKAPARVVQRPATTWHPAMNAGGSTISSSYRPTASYIPNMPSESGISNSTRGASEMDSVCESALTMGAEEWEHLGSFTTTELVTVVNEGGEEHKVRTPVRRSQRIRNRLSPLSGKLHDYL